jgi:hypothetical protein
MRHEGKHDPEKDFGLFSRLKADRHLSPFEHVATPAGDTRFYANFKGCFKMRASASIEAEIARERSPG